jgi:hypothetical protein
MRAAAKDPNAKVMRLKLACIRAARRMLPRDSPPQKVMRLARDLYGWIGDGRHRRKAQKRFNVAAMSELVKDISDEKRQKLTEVLQRTSDDYERRQAGRSAIDAVPAAPNPSLR